MFSLANKFQSMAFRQSFLFRPTGKTFNKINMHRYLTVAFSCAGMRFFGVGGGLRPATPDGRIKVTD